MSNLADVVELLAFRGNPGASEFIYAGMAELADVLDLGSNAARRAGSNPVTRTKNKR